MTSHVRAKPSPLRPELEATAEAARQKAAAELLDVQAVKTALLAVAKDGLRVCVFRPEKPLDLRGTVAALALEKWATREGLSFEWGSPVTHAPDGIERGQSVALVIRWDMDRLKPA